MLSAELDLICFLVTSKILLQKRNSEELSQNKNNATEPKCASKISAMKGHEC